MGAAGRTRGMSDVQPERSKDCEGKVVKTKLEKQAGPDYAEFYMEFILKKMEKH